MNPVPLFIGGGLLFLFFMITLRAERDPEVTLFFIGSVILVSLAFAVLLGACASPRYDSQGNGTWPIDKIERAAVHAVNQEHY